MYGYSRTCGKGLLHGIASLDGFKRGPLNCQLVSHSVSRPAACSAVPIESVPNED